MARTIRRQPFSISTNNSLKTQSLTQVEFNGLCDGKNDVIVDPFTFADTKNVYVGDNGLLMSRPPFKFSGTETGILQQWRFGAYGLRLYRHLCHVSADGTITKIDNPQAYPYKELQFLFTLYCTTHETIGDDEGKLSNVSLLLPVQTIGWHYEPKVTCVEIEDKIFIWFAGMKFFALNLASNPLYFEDATKYLYLPIRKLIINGIETDFETKNFLTDSYRRRYQYSALSDVNFEKLTGKTLDVNLTSEITQNTSTHLYQIDMQEHQDKMMLYPYSPIGDNYEIDIAQTSRATVILRYSPTMNTIEVSFEGRHFKALPSLDEIVGTPFLTKDGLYAVAFTRTGVAQCKLVAQESDDFVEVKDFSWEVHPYMRKAKSPATGKTITITEIDTSFVPIAHFETIEQFAYIFNANAIAEGMPNIAQYLYAEWPDGANGVIGAWSPLIVEQEQEDITLNKLICNRLPTDEACIHFRYISPISGYTDVGATLIIATREFNTSVDTLGPHAIFSTLRAEQGTCIKKMDSASLIIREGSDVIGDIRRAGVHAFVPTVTVSADTGEVSTTVEYKYIVAYQYRHAVDIMHPYDVIKQITRVEGESDFSFVDTKIPLASRSFKIIPNTTNVLTDVYLRIDDSVIMLPQNGELSTFTDDATRQIVNGNNIALTIGDGTYSQIYEGRIHKLSADGESLASGQIKTGDIVFCAPDVFTKDYDLSNNKNKFVIEKLTIADDGNWIGVEGGIKGRELIRLTSFNRAWEYPDAPNWSADKGWPAHFPPYKPVSPNGKGGLRFWSPDDRALPTGPVEIYGFVNFRREVLPLSANENGMWYLIDGTLWTSQPSTENILELDERIEADAHLMPPDHTATLREHYFAFNDKNHLLEVTEVRRDANKLLSDEGDDFLLYLPQRNEQKFTNKITNLHPLSDADIGVFTDKEIWYISAATNSDGTVIYTKPIKSRLPIGCRDGDEIITGLDGQALIFPTPRGITALAPQDFVATTDKTLTYLSDNIQEKYRKFYSEGVVSAILIPHEFEKTYDPQIKIVTYRYWTLFYKYYDREILVFDTRNNAWWVWTTPYPIRSITVDTQLKVLLQIDFSPIEVNDDVTQIATIVKKAPYMGIEYVLADEEFMGYYDDIVDGALNGISEQIYENEFIGYRREFQHASPTIDWRFMSQKLHFNQPNNYKAIKGLTINVKGTDTFKAKLSTKVFRNVYHPEESDVMEISINDLRTFVKRLNLTHAMNFQYRLENDAANTQQLKLNSLSIKYEIKEGVR